MQELKDLKQDYNNILGCSTNLLDALKENQELKQDNEEKGRIIENLKEDMNDLRLEQINKPLKK